MLLSVILLPIVGAIVSMLVGFIWYGPMMFGNTYKNLMHMVTIEDPKIMLRDMKYRSLLGFLTNIIFYFGILVLMNLSYVSDIKSAVIFVVGFWFFIIMTEKSTQAIWSGKSSRDSFKLFLINAFYALVTLVINAVLFILLLKSI